MRSPLQILHLEDDPKDAALVKSAFETGGMVCDIICVQNRMDFLAALEHGGIDLILSDLALPGFDGLSALKIVRARWPQLPMILVSGTMGEERAVDSLKSGATDCVLKERLGRLVPAVRRAVKEIEQSAEGQRMTRQLIEAQKMEVLGQLTGGVAHDFNNILVVIMGYSGLIMANAGPDSPQLTYAKEIQHAAERAAGLTRQLLVFSRKQTVQPIVLDLNKLVESQEQMLRRVVGENIEFTFVLGRDLARVRADPGYIGQVLMNLVVNARDAMPDGGRLTVETDNVTLDANYAQTHAALIPGEYVTLSVKDTGAGMTEEVKARLFEAFFTTKPLGKGTGLGLATCQAIVLQSGGHIEVHSEIGKGSMLKTYFPRVNLPLDAATSLLLSSPLPRGSETLLVVEDEPAVKQMARNILAAQGYVVLLASNGQEALQVVREYKGHIDLVFTDVIMPLMGGKVMSELMKSKYPDLKILFTSGYADEPIARHGVLERGVKFLPKPYTPVSLARKVRESLDG
jgi:two-component system cell cycle sensor histidine kinase/response regulator CckA